MRACTGFFPASSQPTRPAAKSRRPAAILSLCRIPSWYGAAPHKVNAFQQPGGDAHTTSRVIAKNPLHCPRSRGTLFLRLLLLYRLWVVKRSQGHTCGHFFVRSTALQSSRTKLEDGRGSVEVLGTWGIR